MDGWSGSLVVGTEGRSGHILVSGVLKNGGDGWSDLLKAGVDGRVAPLRTVGMARA